MKVTAGDQRQAGRFQDFYFNDRSWRVLYLVVSIEPWRVREKLALVRPEEVAQIQDDEGRIALTISREELIDRINAQPVLPVCRQYAELALGSPGGGALTRRVIAADPHLRSMSAVTKYGVHAEGEPAGNLEDLIFDDQSWEIRYLRIAQFIEQRKIQFHVPPQTVERFAWTTQNVILRELEPVAMLDSVEASAEARAA